MGNARKLVENFEIDFSVNGENKIAFLPYENDKGTSQYKKVKNPLTEKEAHGWLIKDIESWAVGEIYKYNKSLRRNIKFDYYKSPDPFPDLIGEKEIRTAELHDNENQSHALLKYEKWLDKDRWRAKATLSIIS
ncbi:hypothetical protein NSQ26_09720 [Bacillus sp. FSL W7-1360]